MKKRFVVELLFDKEDQKFQTDRDYADFDEARLHCALQVAMNPRILEGRVHDRDASHFPFPYSAENADWARAHLRDWGYSWPFKGLCPACRETMELDGYLPEICEICGRS